MLDLVVKKLERWVTFALVTMLCFVVVLATVELAVTIIQDIAAPPVFFPGIDKLLDIFGRFLLVVIGIELVETMRTFAHTGVVRVQIVLMVAIIALARKIIVLEIGKVTSLSMIGLASLLAGLSIAYQVFVRGTRRDQPDSQSPPDA